MGFIDGTVSACCRPSDHQEVFYNGYKHFHALKYQGVVSSDGLLLHLAGLYARISHDSDMFEDSNLNNILLNIIKFGQTQFLLYGDSGYS